MIYYKRCRLEKGRCLKWSYIPEKFAIEGEVLRLREPSGEWSGGWEVTLVPEMALPESSLHMNRHWNQHGHNKLAHYDGM